MSRQAAAKAGPFVADRNLLFENLSRRREWFQLRRIVGPDAQDLFCRGALACAFNRVQECCRCFHQLIRRAPSSVESYRAYQLLSWMYLRRADFARVLWCHNELRAIQPQNRTLEAGQRLFSALSRFPRQVVTRYRRAVHQYTLHEGSMFIPAAVNGHVVNLMVDSGATISFITESAARKAGLSIHEIGPDTLKLFGATGDQTSFRVALAQEVAVSGLQIAQVVFLVLEDEQFSFSWPYSGALGLPVILAFRTLSWNKDGQFLIGGRTRPAKTGPNLCFDAADLIIDVAVQRRHVNMLLDTGNATTVLWPPFAKAFAKLLEAEGSIGASRLEGVTGSLDFQSVTLENLTLELAEFTASLRRASVLLKTTTPNSRWLSGWVGIDILNQANRVTLDFHNMCLGLESDLS